MKKIEWSELTKEKFNTLPLKTRAYNVDLWGIVPKVISLEREHRRNKAEQRDSLIRAGCESVTYKNIQVFELSDGTYIIPGNCWSFETWNLVKHYIDSEEA